MAEPISFMLNFPRVQQEQFLAVQPRISQFPGYFLPVFMAVIIIADKRRHLRLAEQPPGNIIRIISMRAFYSRFTCEIQVHVAVFPVIHRFLSVVRFFIPPIDIAAHLAVTYRKYAVFPIPAEIRCICIKQPTPPYARIINICACPVRPFRFCAFRNSRIFKPGNLPVNVKINTPDFGFLEYRTACFCFRFLCMHPSRTPRHSKR